MAAIDREAKRVLALFGKHPKRVVPSVGNEQEYFLIKEEDYARRPDLIITGRTLFGAAPCKGQELEEHYFGAIRPTVNNFMKELDDELWALGIAAKTKHNEVAPCQHELAPVFTNANRAVDENLITMEEMRIIASRHGLVCLQHEKPFEGINGSGKHNNWSIATEDANLLDPGETPEENLQFLVFLASVIAAVDEYQDLLRASVATCGNDHRLGANEAPPAIISIFLGDLLTECVQKIVDGKASVHAAHGVLDLGTDVLPKLQQDNSDRNRTSPFAFTGNKFEFRMPGSAVNVSDANMVLDAAVAHELKRFADAMEGVAASDFAERALAFVRTTLTEHQRILFGGNGYAEEWHEEAARRGLANLPTTADALPALVSEKARSLFAEMGVLDKAEVESRYEVKLEKYAKRMNIEARTMERMARRTYLPRISAYATKIAKGIDTVMGAGGVSTLNFERDLLEKLLEGVTTINEAILALRDVHARALETEGWQEKANVYAHEVAPAMEALRAAVDAMEDVVAHDYWPVPTYDDMLFYV